MLTFSLLKCMYSNCLFHLKLTQGSISKKSFHGFFHFERLKPHVKSGMSWENRTKTQKGHSRHLRVASHSDSPQGIGPRLVDKKCYAGAVASTNPSMKKYAQVKLDHLPPPNRDEIYKKNWNHHLEWVANAHFFSHLTQSWCNCNVRCNGPPTPCRVPWETSGRCNVQKIQVRVWFFDVLCVNLQARKRITVYRIFTRKIPTWTYSCFRNV